MIGVDYDLFWTLNPKSLTPFVKAFSLKREYDDAMMWNLGAYVRLAVASIMSKSARYPSAPFGVKKDNSQDMEIIKERFLRKARQINSRFRKEES